MAVVQLKDLKVWGLRWTNEMVWGSNLTAKYQTWCQMCFLSSTSF
jgi:hypothetical protein